jgi:rhodanese-related sulfurtransferase
VTVIDSRIPARFDAGHLAGSINLPVSSAGVGTRAGWALDPATSIVIVAEDPASAHATANALQAVGLWELRGYCIADDPAWEQAELPVVRTGSWDVETLVERLRTQTVELVDVRQRSEWLGGHVAGSHHLPLDRIRDPSSAAIPDRGRTTAVLCAVGVRAAFAASILRRAGRNNVVRVADGGIGELRTRGIRLQPGT